jgi:formylglycine-generating enzyme required for sulfatase activity
VSDWVLATEQAGYTRHFDASALPVSIGGGERVDLVLANVAGTIQIGRLDEVFFVQPARDTENVRLDGELLRGSRRLADGNVIALDTARLTCRVAGGRLSLAIEAQITAGDTAPPDFDALAQDDPSAITVDPIAFSPRQRQEDRRGGKRVSKISLVIYTAFVVLATLGWFAFTAKSVELELEPAADSVDLPDTWLKFRLGDRWLLRSGEHRLVALRAGYYPIEQEISVGTLQDQTVALAFTRLPGLITFATAPEAGAEVRLDGEVIGTTPLADFELRPGTHQVQLTAERYLAELVSLEVEGGHERQELTVALTPSWAPVSVASDPPGAEILVDGRVQGVTPAELELTAGEREIELALAGYNPWRRQIRVVADEPQALPLVELALADGRIALETSPADASVSINGEYRGRTPYELRLRPNVEHQLTVSKPGYARVTQALVLAPGSSRTLALDLEPRLGMVEVTSDPAGAEVLVNGERAGTTPLSLDLIELEQSIELRLEDYAAQTETITPRPGYPQTLAFELEALDTVSGGGYPRTVTTSFGQRLILISVPSEPFQMGATRGDLERRTNETLRTVQLTRAFYAAEKEMTNGEYRRLCDPNHDSGTFERHSLNDDDQPVVNVRVREIAQCLNRLSIAAGLQPVYDEVGGVFTPARPLRSGYRLPTEAEWAYAARYAGREDQTPARFSWGQELSGLPDRHENIADLAAQSILSLTLVATTDGHAVTAPVGSFAPNAAGLYDMGGNVAEWVQDFYDPFAGATDEVLADPLGPETGRLHVVRGPSWQSATEQRLRLSYRDYEDDGRENLGFRIARNLE